MHMHDVEANTGCGNLDMLLDMYATKCLDSWDHGYICQYSGKA